MRRRSSFVKIIAIFFLISLISSMFRGLSGKREEPDSEEEKIELAKNESEYDETESESEEQENYLDFGLNEFEGREYSYLTAKDMSKYSTLLIGKKIYTIISIKSMGENKITSKKENGKSLIIDVGNELFGYYNAKLNKGDKIVVIGKIGKTSEKKIKMSDGYVIAIGNDVSDYEKDKSDNELIDQALSKVWEMYGDKFKNYCDELWYDDIFFSKENLEGKLVKLQVYLEEKKFFAMDSVYDSTVQNLKKEYGIQRDFFT